MALAQAEEARIQGKFEMVDLLYANKDPLI